MSQPEQFPIPNPTWRLYSIAFVLSAAVGGALSAIWLEAASVWIAAVIAGIAALFGVFQLESIGDALWETAVWAVIIAVFPKNYWIALIAVPAATGLGIGKLACGLWKEWR